MKTINQYTGEGYKSILYPDNQPHIQLTASSPEDARVIWPIRSSLEMMQLLEVSNALDHVYSRKKDLVIPYLMGARFDRVMNHGDSFDLEVVADLINSMNFERVNLFDVHSEVATALIKRSHSHNNSKLVMAYDQEDAILILPDAGAAKKSGKYAEWNPRISSAVQCIKSRDLETGGIQLVVLEPQKCEDNNCVIIDDICDGGATFLAIAKQIKPKHLALIVSHGIFSKGFRALDEAFDQIITSDSYYTHLDSKKLTTIPLNL